VHIPCSTSGQTLRGICSYGSLSPRGLRIFCLTGHEPKGRQAVALGAGKNPATPKTRSSDHVSQVAKRITSSACFSWPAFKTPASERAGGRGVWFYLILCWLKRRRRSSFLFDRPRSAMSTPQDKEAQHATERFVAPTSEDVKALEEEEGENLSVVDENVYHFDESRKLGVTSSVFLILNKMIGTGSLFPLPRWFPVFLAGFPRILTRDR
jgi:hypothetical protein